MAINLFLNQTTDGDSKIVSSPGGYGIYKLSGTLDGAVITFQFDFHDNDFQPLVAENVVQQMIIPGIQTLVFLKPGIRFKAVLSGAGASTDVTLDIIGQGFDPAPPAPVTESLLLLNSSDFVLLNTSDFVVLNN